jgi:Rnl2 family RNA ligase
MLHYPSIENHYNEKNLTFWTQKHPELNVIPFVAQQKYDGSNLSIEFTEVNTVNYYSRNQLLVDLNGFYDLGKVMSQKKYISLLDTIKTWKQKQQQQNAADVRTIHLFGEFYGPGIQKRIDYLHEDKEIKFFDVYFNRKLQSPLEFKNWMSELNISEFLVDFLVTGTLSELLDIGFLDKCKQMVRNDIEGVVIKPLEKQYLNINGHPFYIKYKCEGFEDLFVKNVKKKKNLGKKVEKKSRSLIDFITENRIQDCKGKQPWINMGHLVDVVVKDAFDDYKKSIEQIEKTNANIEDDLTPSERKNLSKRAWALSSKLYEPNTGNLLLLT